MELSLEKALQQIGDQIVAQMRLDLQRDGNDNSGRLSNSITATVEENQLIISMDGYGKWVNNGAERGAGRKPPIKAIERWILKDNITPRGKITAKQLPFVIQAAIGKRGQTRRKAYPFIEPAITEVLSKDFDPIFNKAIDTITQQYFNPKK